MTQPSFLARTTLGQPNYILVAMAIAFVAALVPRGARLAVESGVQRAADWLPAQSSALADSAWFGEQFSQDAANALVGGAAGDDFLSVIGLAAVAACAVGYWCLGSIILSVIVAAAGLVSAGVSLAAVYYFGAIEMALLGLSEPRLGIVDPLVMLVPAAVYAASVCGSVWLVNNYQTYRRSAGAEGAAEQAVRTSWAPCAVATLALVAAIVPLCASDILPLQRFGLFTALGIVAGLGMQLTLVPVLLHCLPAGETTGAFAWTRGVAANAFARPTAICVMAAAGLAAAIGGMGNLTMSPRIWQGRTESLEVVLTVPSRHLRPHEAVAPHHDGQYRMTVAERQALVREVEDRLAGVAGLGATTSASARVDAQTRRELWRISAPVRDAAAYTELMMNVRQAVDPVLLAYQQRNRIVARLHEAGKQLAESRLCILYRSPADLAAAALGAQEAALANLLQRSGLAPKTTADGKLQKALSSFNLAQLDAQADNPKYLEAAIKTLGEQDALVLVSAGDDPTARHFAEAGVMVIDVSQLAVPDPAKDVAAVYAGTAPLLAEAQRHLPASLRKSLMWVPLAVAAVLMIGMASPVGGLTALAVMGIYVTVILGGLGLLRIELDLGVAVSSWVAAVVAAYGTCHFLACYRRGLRSCLNQQSAVRLACERCAPAIVQTAMVVGFALAVLAMSDFELLDRMGNCVGPMLGFVVLAELMLLPASVAGPLGRMIGAPAEAPAIKVLVMETPVIEPILLEDELETVEAELAPPPVIECEPEALEPAAELATVEAPRFELSDEERVEVLAGPHGALHAKLRSLRRELPPHGARP